MEARMVRDFVGGLVLLIAGTLIILVGIPMLGAAVAAIKAALTLPH